MATYKTVVIGGTTLTVSPRTYHKLVVENREVAMADALKRRDFATYNRLKHGEA